MKQKVRLFSLLKISVNGLFGHLEVLFPFCIIIFLQLFILEILYFSPRYPLNYFFAPLINGIHGSQYLNYPMNFIVLPQLFELVQLPITIFINCLLVGVAIHIWAQINDGKRSSFRPVVRYMGRNYVHLVVAAIVMSLLAFGFSHLFELAVHRAMGITAQSGWKLKIKNVIIYGAPYLNILLKVITATLLAYVYPLIIIGKKNVFLALWLNFKELPGKFWLTFMVVLVPSLVLVPFILLSRSFGSVSTFPESTAIILGIGIFIVVLIEAVISLTLASVYLIEKED